MWINLETDKSKVIEKIIKNHKEFFDKKGLFFTELEHEKQAEKTYEFIRPFLGVNEWANL